MPKSQPQSNSIYASWKFLFESNRTQEFMQNTDLEALENRFGGQCGCSISHTDIHWQISAHDIYPMCRSWETAWYGMSAVCHAHIVNQTQSRPPRNLLQPSRRLESELRLPSPHLVEMAESILGVRRKVLLHLYAPVFIWILLTSKVASQFPSSCILVLATSW